MKLVMQIALGIIIGGVALIVACVVLAGVLLHDTVEEVKYEFCDDTRYGTPVVQLTDWPYESVSREECISYLATATAEAAP